jgi:hypothetical protein
LPFERFGTDIVGRNPKLKNHSNTSLIDRPRVSRDNRTSLIFSYFREPQEGAMTRLERNCRVLRDVGVFLFGVAAIAVAIDYLFIRPDTMRELQKVFNRSFSEDLEKWRKPTSGSDSTREVQKLNQALQLEREKMNRDLESEREKLRRGVDDNRETPSAQANPTKK